MRAHGLQESGCPCRPRALTRRLPGIWKHVFGMKLGRIIPILLAGAVLGCRTAPREQDIWVAFGCVIPPYANFYEQPEEYPAYAIAEYTINEPYDERNDLKYLHESLRLCRSTFGKAFRAGRLQRFNSEDGYDPQKPEIEPECHAFIPFKPGFIVIAIQNRAEHHGESTFAASYKVAYIISTEQVLSDHYDFQRALQSAYIDRSPFRLDPPSPEEKKRGQYLAGHYRWVAIERHEALLRRGAGGAEPGGSADGSQTSGPGVNRTPEAAGFRP